MFLLDETSTSYFYCNCFLSCRLDCYSIMVKHLVIDQLSVDVFFFLPIYTPVGREALWGESVLYQKHNTKTWLQRSFKPQPCINNKATALTSVINCQELFAYDFIIPGWSSKTLQQVFSKTKQCRSDTILCWKGKEGRFIYFRKMWKSPSFWVCQLPPRKDTSTAIVELLLQFCSIF